MGEHEDLVLAIGPYLLGALDAETRAAVRTHLDTCETCREELVRLAAVPGLLAHAGPPRLDLEAEPAAALRQRLVAEVERERLARRRRDQLLTAAAVLLLVLLPAASFLTLQRDQPAPERPYLGMVSNGAQESPSGRIGWTRHRWGAELFIVAEGLDADQRFALLVEGRDGRREQAATWEGVGGRIRAIGTTSLHEDEIARFVVANEAGEEVLTLEPS